MNLFPNEEYFMRDEIESWMAFANDMRDECDKKEFEDMVNNYCKYSQIIIKDCWRAFPSKPLVLNLLFFQYRKIMQWLYNKTARN